MAVNQSARLIQLLVGGKDYSPGVLRVDGWNTKPLDDGGLITTTATVTILNVRGLPGSLDDRVNTADFHTGQTIVVSTTKSDGTFAVHPTGRLRLLSSEFNPEAGTLTLNCGCLLTLLNYRAPTDSTKAQIDPGVFTSRNNIISKLLTEAGITSVSNPFSIGYPINYGLNLTGSYLQAVGKLLYDAGYYGWVNSNENFCIRPINLLAPATFAIKIGGDAGEELWYRRLNGTEGVREIVKVVGVTKIAQPPGFPSNNTTTRYGDAATVDPTLNGPTVISYQEIQETYDKISKIRVIVSTTYSPVGLVLPNLNFSSPGSKLGLIVSEKKIEKKHYESGIDGKLILHETEIYRVFGSVLAEYIEYAEANTSTSFPFKTVLMLAELITANYLYDASNKPKEVKTTKYETEGALLSGTDHDWSLITYAGTPSNLRQSEATHEEWVEQRTNEWVRTVFGYKTLARVKPEVISAMEEAMSPPPAPGNTSAYNLVSAKLRLVLDDSASVREVSNSGQTNPAAPEQQPPDAGFEDEQIKGEAQFAQFGGNPLQERERTFQIEYLEGKTSSGPGTSALPSAPGTGPQAQCEKMAVLEGQLLFGRHKGQDLGMNLRDELFDWEPLMRVNCTEPDGTIRAYALDNAQWYLGNDRAMVNFDGIWVGTVGGSSVPQPVTATVGGTLVVVTVV